MEYRRTLDRINSEIISSRIKVVKDVTYHHIKLYLSIGEIILINQTQEGWGKSVVEKLSRDLKKNHPNSSGFSARNLWDMRRFFEKYSKNEFLRQAVAEIPWGHNLLILNKIKDQNEAEYYIHTTKKFGWSRNILLNQIKANAFQRSLTENKQHNFIKALPEHLIEQANEAIKSEYNLDFLGLTNGVKERDLENKMIEKIRNVIMEFGSGFAFLGSQYKIQLGAKDYFIDLLFYHRHLQCLVAIELKSGEFKPEHAGKLNFYLEVLDNTEKTENENPSIGILLCAQKDDLEVEYALRVSNKPIGIAEYKLTKSLPKNLQKYLPDNSELINRLKEN